MWTNAQIHIYDGDCGLHFRVITGDSVEIYRISGNYPEEFHFPSTITYNDTVYKVININGGALPRLAKSVYIPESIDSIGNGWLASLYNIENLYIEDSPKILYWSESPYRSEKELHSVYLGRNIGRANTYQLYNTPFSVVRKIKNLTIGKEVNTLSMIDDSHTPSVLYGCDSIHTLIINDCSSTLDVKGLRGHLYGVDSVYIGRNLTAHDYFNDFNPFLQNEDIRTLTIDGEATSMLSFVGCTNLQHVSLGNGVTEIDGFCRCTNLKSIQYGGNVTRIGERAFKGCESLTSIVIPDSLTSIYAHAFYGCENLKDIYVSSLDSWLRIEGKDNLIGGLSVSPRETRLYIDGKEVENITIPEEFTSISNSSFLNVTSLRSVIIPEGVDTIGYYAFRGCTGLTSISLPSSVQSIGGGAFYGCTNMREIYVFNPIPPSFHKTSVQRDGSNSTVSIQGSVFEGINKGRCTLYVPKGSYEAYVTAKEWTDFNNIVEYDPEDRGTWLTINSFLGGKVRQKVEIGNTYEFIFTPETDWKINTVTFNGEDVTASVNSDGYYKTPIITADASISIVFVKPESDAIYSAKASQCKLYATSEYITIKDAEIGNAVSIYGTDGKNMLNTSIKSSTQDIPFSDSGLYIIKVGTQTFKLIK